MAASFFPLQSAKAAGWEPRAALAPFPGESKECTLAAAQLPHPQPHPFPPLPRQIAWKAGRTSPEHHLSPRDEPKWNLPGKVEQKPAQLSPASIWVAVPHLWAFCRLHSLHNPGSPPGRLLEGGLITVEILVH